LRCRSWKVWWICGTGPTAESTDQIAELEELPVMAQALQVSGLCRIASARMGPMPGICWRRWGVGLSTGDGMRRDPFTITDAHKVGYVS
jgi:hypothetical protein